MSSTCAPRSTGTRRRVPGASLPALPAWQPLRSLPVVICTQPQESCGLTGKSAAPTVTPAPGSQAPGSAPREHARNRCGARVQACGVMCGRALTSMSSNCSSTRRHSGLPGCLASSFQPCFARCRSTCSSVRPTARSTPWCAAVSATVRAHAGKMPSPMLPRPRRSAGAWQPAERRRYGRCSAAACPHGGSTMASLKLLGQCETKRVQWGTPSVSTGCAVIIDHQLLAVNTFHGSSCLLTMQELE